VSDTPKPNRARVSGSWGRSPNGEGAGKDRKGCKRACAFKKARSASLASKDSPYV
jgi:hypothetical protein